MPHDDDQKCKEYQRWVIEYCQYRYPQQNHSLRNHQNNQSSTSTINHDQHHPNSSSNTTTFVMSRTLDHNSNPWEWSQCSRHYVTTFLEWVGFLLINIKIIYVCGFSICLLNWTWVEWSFTFLPKVNCHLCFFSVQPTFGQPVTYFQHCCWSFDDDGPVNGDDDNFTVRSLSWWFCSKGFGFCLSEPPRRNYLEKEQKKVALNINNNNNNITITSKVARYAGEFFDENRQCELVFGLGSLICSYMPPCKRLWCSTPEGEVKWCWWWRWWSWRLLWLLW